MYSSVFRSKEGLIMLFIIPQAAWIVDKESRHFTGFLIWKQKNLLAAVRGTRKGEKFHNDKLGVLL